MSDYPADPAAIERDLAVTRARLGSRLDELTSRLSPGQLIDAGLAYLRRGQGAEFVRHLGTDLRDNPLPVAVTGIGLAWLMVSSGIGWNRTIPSSRALVPYDGPGGVAGDGIAERARLAGEAVVRGSDEAEEAFGARIAEARAQVLGLQREAAETAAAFAERVQQALEASGRSLRDGVEQLGQKAREWGDDIAGRTRRAGETLGQATEQSRQFAARAGGTIAEAIDKNPLLLGALGLSAGVLLAALLPRTDQEDAVVAPLADGIRQAAGEVVERGTRAAEAAVASAYHEAVRG